VSIEDDARFYPDRALAYARWLLSRDPARLDEGERQAREFLLGDAGKAMLDILETGEREIGQSSAKGYATYLMTAHRLCLRSFGRMLPPRLLEVLWYAFWVASLVLLGVAFWMLVRLRREGWFRIGR
jgi:hypothetical protein